eukprot:jgi/Chrzof1/12181/Cz06g24070.t1
MSSTQQVADVRQTITSNFIPGSAHHSSKHLHLVVLNYTLPKLTKDLWHQAETRVCADGGANRLYDELPSMIRDEDTPSVCCRVHHLPDIIKGDMDSVRSDVREFYSGHGVPIVDLSDDQDTTDLTKCIMFLEKHIFARQRQSAADANIEQEEEQQHGGSNCNGAAPGPQSSADAVHTRGLDHCILVLGALGGRLDHTLAALNTLYCFPHLDIVLWGERNLVRLLPRGKSVIKPELGMEGPTCGLVPLAAPATASSTGLKWNLNNTQMRFRGLLSTSNIIVSDTVEVDTDEELLWITEVKDDLPQHNNS